MSRILPDPKNDFQGHGTAMEGLDDVLYDTVDVPPKGGIARLFGKVYGDEMEHILTNMEVVNALPNPQEFNIARFYGVFFDLHGLVCVWHPIYWKSCVKFNLGDVNKPYWHSPCWAIAPPAAILGMQRELCSEDVGIVKNACSLGRLTSPVVLTAGRWINASLTVNGIFPGMKFIFLLEGERARSYY